MQELANAFIVDGTVNEMGNLILTTAGGVEIDAGPVILYGTASQYYRGDKQWAELDKTAVGLSNVDNVSVLNGYIPKWLPNVAYLAGDLVISPMGELVKAKSALAGVTVYNAANWAIVSLGESVIVRTNLTRNPGMHTTATDVVSTAGGGTPTISRVTTGGPSGVPNFARVTAGTAGWTYMDIRTAGAATNLVTAGFPYASSASIRSSIAGSVTVYVQWVDAGGAILSTTTSPALPNIVANTWTRYGVSGIAPANAVRAITIFRVNMTSAVGATVDGTAFMFEQSDDPTKPYFDPTWAADTLTYSWTGAAYLSTSIAVSTSTAFVPKWKGGVTYAAGAQVISPRNEVVTSKTARTSEATFTSSEAGNWAGEDNMMMFGNSGFTWSGGASWDAGVLAVDNSVGSSSQRSSSAAFAVPGSLSGAIKFTEPGIYDIVWDNYCAQEPGNAGYRINSSGTWPGPIDNPNGVVGVGIKMNGQTYWETKVVATGIRVPQANLEVRLVGIQINGSVNTPRVKIIKRASI
jgi:hypothetical protein